MRKKSNGPSAPNESVIGVKLHPKSSRNQIVGREGDVIKVKVTSPPVDGKANKALIELLSKKLGIPKRKIGIITGKRSRLKSVYIRGLSLKEIDALLLGE